VVERNSEEAVVVCDSLFRGDKSEEIGVDIVFYYTGIRVDWKVGNTFRPPSFNRVSYLLPACVWDRSFSLQTPAFLREGRQASSCLRGLATPSFPLESGVFRFNPLFGWV
jgi:hypothetical protein